MIYSLGASVGNESFSGYQQGVLISKQVSLLVDLPPYGGEGGILFIPSFDGAHDL